MTDGRIGEGVTGREGRVLVAGKPVLSRTGLVRSRWARSGNADLKSSQFSSTKGRRGSMVKMRCENDEHYD